MGGGRENFPGHKLDPWLSVFDGAGRSRSEHSRLLLFPSVVHRRDDDIASGSPRTLLCLRGISDQLFTTITTVEV